MRLFGVAILALLSLCARASGQLVSQNTGDGKAFESVERIGEATGRSFFIFPTSDHNYAIRHDGRSESSTTTGLRRSFLVPVGPGGRIDRLYFREYQADLFLLYEVTDSHSNWGYLLRFDQIKRKTKWIMPVEAFNISPGVIEGEFAYLAAADFIAKVDLRSGKYAWENKGIDKQSAGIFAEFKPPVVTADRVMFREGNEAGRTIEVSKESGEILSVRRSAPQ